MQTVRVRRDAHHLGCRSSPFHVGSPSWRLFGKRCCLVFETRRCLVIPRGLAPGLRASWAAFRQPLALVVQVYCPLEGSPFHRLLHVFACPYPRCRSGGARSWKVFRSQCLQTREEAARDSQKQENGLAAEDWCEGADDWGSDSEEAPPQLTLDFGNDASSAKDRDWTAQLQDLHLQDTVLGAAPPVSPGKGVALPSVVPQFLPYYISVVDEDDYGDFVSLDHAHSLLRDYQQREGIDMEQLLSQSLPSDVDEKYEKTITKSGDKVFYKFMKRIGVCQEQILRSFCGIWDNSNLHM
ncbi:programmed cell death protein 2-like isoform X4 [Manis javanica]|uniref:programmed cell death protein 2-like isoform X4 n=1 Tax=Manis javanica TaxID=9974 RepID=UPI003C6CDB73